MKNFMYAGLGLLALSLISGGGYAAGIASQIIVDPTPVVLLSNATATGSATIWQGGPSWFDCIASSWSSASVKLQALGPNGTTYLDVDNTSLGANGGVTDIPLRNGTYKAVVTGSPTGLYCNLSRAG